MRTIDFELCLTRDENLLATCKKEIRQVTGASLKTLIDSADENIAEDCYLLKLRVKKNKIWDTARRLILIEGVLDVDPDLNTSLDDAYLKLFLEEGRELEKPKNRPDPKWFHANTRFKEAMEYATEEFKAGRGSFNPSKTRIPVAHFDTGYTDHPEIRFMDKKAGYNYIAGFFRRIVSPGWQRDARDRLRNFRPFLWASHGTATAAAIIGSRITDKKTISGSMRDRVNGVMPHHVDLIPFRISENIISFNNKMVHAVDQVIRLGNIRIITMSHASLFAKKSWKNAVEKAYNHGIIWVAAGGSHAFGKLRSIVVFPARFRETIAAAASTINDLPWDRTHYGTEIDICAPGFDMYVPSSRRQWYGLLPDSYTYKWSEGTSFSTPLTAAAAALWMAHHGEEKLDALYPLPWQRVEAFRRVLRATARPHKPEIPPDRYGAGILDVLELIKAELPDPNELISASPENMHRKALTGRSEKIEYITGKEILYLIACAKMKEVDKPGDALFHYVYRNASDEARHLLDNRIGQDFLLDEPNPRSEALKRYGKELLNSLS